MKLPIVFRPAARQDLLGVCAWYEQRRPGLGDHFEAAVERTLDMISGAPASFPTVHRDVRRALVRPFPYGVFYRIRGEAVHVLAVMHGRRDPTVSESRPDVN